MIYADNAATTELDIEAFEAMRPYLMQQYGNASQPYSFGMAAKKALIDARKRIALCIGADPDEIFFTSGGTESDNWAIKSCIGTKKGILTSNIEHHAVLNACRYVERQGIPVFYLPVSSDGIVSPNEIEKRISDDVQLVSVMFANNEIGTIEPVKELVAVAHRYGCLFHTDAVQAVGHIDINVHDLGIDMLSASAHKFNGPKGVGFLYKKKGIDLLPFMDGGSQESGHRAGTENIASIVAMAVALEVNNKNISANQKRLDDMERLLIKRLDAGNIDYKRNGSANHIPGSISLSFKDLEGEMILHRMDLKGVCISTGSACDSVNTQVSHVIKAIKLPDEYALGTIRISFGKNNTSDEVEAIADALIAIIK